MRYLILDEVSPGMRLANDLFDASGRTLIGQGNKLTDRIIEKLLEYGFDGIYVEDSLSEDIKVEDVISPQLRAEGMDCIRNADIDRCMEIARMMVEEILQNGALTIDLVNLRSFDDYTYAHSVNVAVLCGVMGLGFGLDEEELTCMITAALIHDLGKLSIPGNILNKPSRLTPEEFQIMKSHPQLSYELIQNRLDIAPSIKTAVLYHHENVDGSGYPHGIKGDEHTLFTKILHVADVYDALVSKRPYKKPYSSFDAAEYLMANCGTLFDLESVKMLLTYVPLFPKGTEVVLSDGQKGIIYGNSGIHNLRPIIRTENGSLIDLTQPPYLSYTLSSINEETQQARKDSEAERNKMIGLSNL